MFTKRSKKVWVVYIVLLLIICFSLYKSVHVIPEGHKAFIYPNAHNFFNKTKKIGTNHKPGVVFTIPFMQEVRLYTEMTSGKISLYKPDFVIEYSYVINQSHIKDFHLRSSSSHAYIEFLLGAAVRKLIDDKSSLHMIKTEATKVFSEFILNDKKRNVIEPFFKEFSVRVINR